MDLIVQRLNSSKWVSVLKCLLILHRGVDLVGSNYPQKISELNLLLSSFNDQTEKGCAHNKIIQDYYSYIKLKGASFSRAESLLNVDDTEKARAVAKLRNRDIIKELRELLNQLEALVKLGPSLYQALRNYNLRLTQNTVFFVLKDSASLYKATSLLIDKALEIFKTIKKEDAEIIIELYQRFEIASRTLEQFFKMSEGLPYTGLSTPLILNRPKNTISSMKEYLSSEESSKNMGKSDSVNLTPPRVNDQKKVEKNVEVELKKKGDMERQQSLSMGSSPSGNNDYKLNENSAEKNKTDYMFEAFNQPGPRQGNLGFASQGMMNQGMMNPAMMNPTMMSQGMMNPGMMNPGMMNPGMMSPGMMNPMMMNPMMINPMANGMMMGGMMNPFMTGMNPMMAGMGTSPVKSNVDPLFQPVGSPMPSNKKNPFETETIQIKNNFTPGSNNFDNIFAERPSRSLKSQNPFDTPNEFKKSQTSLNSDPFSDLI